MKLSTSNCAAVSLVALQLALFGLVATPMTGNMIPTCRFPKIFAHILRACGYLEDFDTIYVLVDTRNLADHATRDPGLPH